ncbi:hypothetical protein A1O1_04374 [Capronia coronata CBS 617.96]|uniref:Uncharacterized protein n=1 Tax=Capronia coronata CBS 617.96 TaxID=1182541 RepID=W9Z9R3_9EURO|nr:uncharacterized protein A1O1_04374 [Capronia coronata CBS 617.96]EXJ91264.1 hypothetical protein A1O1_04374 [Capronia coronata CBS 617.96]
MALAPSPKSLSYTANPLLLILNDLWLFAQITITWPLTAGLPSIVLPISPAQSKGLDELALTWPNLWSDLIHSILVVAQTLFLISLFPLSYILLPVLYFLYIVAFVLGNQWFTVLLNGRRRIRFQSHPRCVEGQREYKHERWVFINGVAVGQHWLQSNLDRLAMTFRRPVYGIHNQTRGIIFDVLECIIQRDLAYPTLDIRQAYEQLLPIITDPEVHKVVLILHSQGCIEGGMVLDWLYATVAAEQIRKLEVYTFGNAANHWNAPVITTTVSPNGQSQGRTNGTESTTTNGDTSIDARIRASTSNDSTVDDDDCDSEHSGRVVRYIEHYANTGDYVSRFGILHFRPEITQPQPQPQAQARPHQQLQSQLYLQGQRQIQQPPWTGSSTTAAAASPPVRNAAPSAPPTTTPTSLRYDDDASATGTSASPSGSTLASTSTVASAVATTRKLNLATTNSNSRYTAKAPVRSYTNLLSPTTPIERKGTLDAKEDYNKYVGRLFKRVGSGHQFNQHYLDNIFEMEGIDTRDLSRGRVKGGNAFMDAEVDLDAFDLWDTVQAVDGAGHGHGQGRRQEGRGDAAGLGVPSGSRVRRKQVKDFSRLWLYRNGMSPDEARA